MNRRYACSFPCLLLLAAGLLGGPAQAQETYTVAFTYDAQGRLTGAAYDDAVTVTYTYDAAGNRTALSTEGAVAVDEAPEMPTRFALHGSYPNPFNPTATVPFDVKEPVHVRLAVYDVLGRQVAVLVDERRAAGRYETVFGGRGLPSGLYFYRIEMGGFRAVKKMLLVK